MGFDDVSGIASPNGLDYALDTWGPASLDVRFTKRLQLSTELPHSGLHCCPYGCKKRLAEGKIPQHPSCDVMVDSV